MTNFTIKRKFIVKAFTYIAIFVISSLWSSELVIAQTAFLVSPYYGEETITQGYGGSHSAIDYGMNYEVVVAAEGGTVDTVTWWNNNCHNSATWPNDDNNCGFGPVCL